MAVYNCPIDALQALNCPDLGGILSLRFGKLFLLLRF